MDRHPWLRASDRSSARSAHPPRPYSRDERRQLSPEEQPTAEPDPSRTSPAVTRDRPAAERLSFSQLVHTCSGAPVHVSSGLYTQPRRPPLFIDREDDIRLALVW